MKVRTKAIDIESYNGGSKTEKSIFHSLLHVFRTNSEFKNFSSNLMEVLLEESLRV